MSCASRQYKKTGFPIEAISDILKVKANELKEVEELKKYIVLKNYDFYVFDYDNNGFESCYTTAVSKDKNIFFFLNYPELVAFNNFNTIMESEKYSIIDNVHAELYIKFLSKLFIPDMIHLDEVNEAIENGTLPNKPEVLKLSDNYKTIILSGEKDYISSDFYALSNHNKLLMYHWQLGIKVNGTIVDCKITMLQLKPDYTVEDKLVIFDKTASESPANNKM